MDVPTGAVPKGAAPARAAPAGVALTKAEQARALLAQGLARHNAGDLAAAEALYRRALRLSPGDPNALNLLGVAARQRGDLAEAVRLTGEALQTRPDSPVFLAAHGGALAEAGQAERAVPVLRRAVALRPADALSQRNLGQALLVLGDAASAVSPLRTAASLMPEPENHLALAYGLREAGDAAGAAAAARAALAGAPDAVAAQARFLLAALGTEAAPDRAPASYVRELFDRYAPRFDAHLQGTLNYRTPEALAAALRAAGIAAEGAATVLDLGCGTGLSGAALRPFAARLEGLDLSPGMLREAARAGHYDALHEADLLGFLPAHPGAFTIVAAVDVLNYLGDLTTAFRGMATALQPGGVAAFSLEVGEEAPYALGEGMRFRHHPTQALALLASAGFQLLLREDTVLRQEKGRDVAGLILVARR
ncbi:tetratricopeptide repeat protein [Roseomonas elaeocarpi]|uniref:Tetratricopeptide repeat protein n=1 Tax=Roseomonas elaeocarpi TaxID=907779 RepID=A0ABV6JSN1_9PROT